MSPARGKLLVRPVQTAETLPGGKILLTDATRQELTAQQAEVVAIGAPSDCEEEPCERLHGWHSATPLPGINRWELDGRFHPVGVEPGAWVLLAPRCLVETDIPELCVCAQDDVLAVLEA